MSIRRYAVLWRAGIALALAALIVGCGAPNGDSGRTGRGRLTLTIRWPATTRVIPEATRSIKVQAEVLEPDNGEIVGTVVVPRPADQPTSAVTLDDLPSVKVRVTATAHEAADGTGAVLAEGSIDVRVPENGSVPAQITLQAADDTVFEGDLDAFGQQHLDSLATGITEITGRLHVFDTVQSPVQNLNALRDLRRVGGDLVIERASFTYLTSFRLPILTEIGGSLIITDGGGGRPTGSLITVDLPVLTEIGVTLSIQGSPQQGETVVDVRLPALVTQRNSVSVVNNRSLRNLTLGGISGGDPRVYGAQIANNPQLEVLHIASINISASFDIQNNDSLPNLNGIASGSVGKSLSIFYNRGFTNEHARAFADRMTLGGTVGIGGNGP